MVLAREHLEIVLDEGLHVRAPVAERRHVDAQHVQSIEQVGTELARRDSLGQIAIGRGNHSHVHDRPARAAAADRLKFARLEKAQEQRLHADAHLCHFIEEDRAAVCLP